jgi:hypothetical protein
MKELFESVRLPVVMGIIIGFLSYLLSLSAQLALATILLGAVLGTQFEAMRRAQAQDPRKPLEAVRGISIEISAMLERILVEAPERLRRISEEPDMLRHIARDLRKLDGTMQKAEAGHLEVEADDTAILNGWAEEAKHSIDGTVLAAYSVEWNRSARGLRIWDIQMGRLRRGVRIRRLFIYDTMSDDVRELVGKQVAAGIECRLIDITRLSQPFVRDVNIFDGRRLHEAYFGTEGRAWVDRYSVAEADVDVATAQFNRLFDLAQEPNALGSS